MSSPDDRCSDLGGDAVLALLGCQGDGRDAGGGLNVGTRQARGDDFAHHDLIRRGKAEILKPSVLGIYFAKLIFY